MQLFLLTSSMRQSLAAVQCSRVQSDLEAGSNSSSRFNRSRRSRFFASRRAARRAQDGCFLLRWWQIRIARSVTSIGFETRQDFLAWRVMSNHAHFVGLPRRRDRSRPRSEKRIADTRGRSISVKAFKHQIRFSINPPYWPKVQYTGVIVIH